MKRNKFAHETRTKISSLLAKKKTKSQQHLVSYDSDESNSNHNTFHEAIDADIHREEDLSVENKSYILDKFLNDSTQEQTAPVPKPRRSKIKSPGAETYTVSPSRNESVAAGTPSTRRKDHREGDGIEMDVIETASNRTFDVNPGSRDNSSESASENKSKENEARNAKTKLKGKEIVNKVKNTRNNKREIKRNDESLTENDVYNYSEIINVIIHRSDRLLLDSFVVHPVVKVHFVNSESGEYLKKSDKSRNIIFYYENKEIDYIGPVMTQAYNLQENRSLHPNWEESILINEDFKYFTDQHNILIFFEVMDFLSSIVIKHENTKDQLGWRKIAWAFLKPNSPTYTNVNKTSRLQLYYPSSTNKPPSPGKCEIFPWWLKRKFRKYPSTLYVSINSIVSPTAAVETLRSRAPNEIETGTAEFNIDVPKTSSVNNAVRSENEEIAKEGGIEVVWERKDKQMCKVPNKCVYKVDGYEEGCLTASFSHSGLYLACSIGCEDIFLLVIHSILEKRQIAKIEAHQGLIYEIVWSLDDKLMLTASADCTVCLWNMESYTFIQMLPHPSFVYTCDLHDNIIATGCFDKCIRLWEIDGEAEYELKDELGEHLGFVTSVKFNESGTLLYTADSIGAINVWKYSDDRWTLRKQIKVLDLKDTIINQILLHKKERKLFANSRDSKIRLIDIKTGYVLQTYHGAYNTRVNIKCCLTPCGNFILSGSEHGDLYIWDTETGRLDHTISPYDIQIELHCVQYHPKDNYFVVSHYGNNLPVMVYKYDKESDEKGSAKKTADPHVGATFKIDVIKKDALSFKEILQKMDHLISPQK